MVGEFSSEICVAENTRPPRSAKAKSLAALRTIWSSSGSLKLKDELWPATPRAGKVSSGASVSAIVWPGAMTSMKRRPDSVSSWSFTRLSSGSA